MARGTFVAKLSVCYITRELDGVKMYMFDKNNEWLSFEQAFLKYSPITYTWCEFKEPTKSLHGEVNL